MFVSKALALIAIVLLYENEAKIYKKCDLARELHYKYKFGRTMMSSWICMIMVESGYDTKKMNTYKPIPGRHPSPYKSYGLFQINSKSYCGMGYVGGKCNVRCESLLTDDISKSVHCAQIVLKTDGFKAWKQWTKHCKRGINKLPSTKECFPNDPNDKIEDETEFRSELYDYYYFVPRWLV